jgi:hypothetical protein
MNEGERSQQTRKLVHTSNNRCYMRQLYSSNSHLDTEYNTYLLRLDSSLDRKERVA